jgi:hypothetical protein
MKHVSGWTGLFAGVSALLGLLGCVAKSDGREVGGETHWLDRCDDNADCGGELECLCGRCTRVCADTAACEPFDADAECLPVDAIEFAASCQQPPSHLCAKSEAMPSDDTETDGSEDAGPVVTTTPDTDEPTETSDDQTDDTDPVTSDETSTDTDCDEPGLKYICLGDCCSGADWACDEGETGFETACGCGCSDPTPDDDSGALIAKGGERFDALGGCGVETVGYVPYSQVCDLAIIEAVAPDGSCYRLQDSCLPPGFVAKKPDAQCVPCSSEDVDAGPGPSNPVDAGTEGCAGLNEEACDANPSCIGARGQAYDPTAECFADESTFMGCVDAEVSCPPSITAAYDGAGQCYSTGGCVPEGFERAAPEDPCAQQIGAACL